MESLSIDLTNSMTLVDLKKDKEMLINKISTPMKERKEITSKINVKAPNCMEM